MGTPSGAREFDIVLFGASGFVGRLTAARLAQPDESALEPGLRIALAGRSESRLADTRARLPSAAADWPLIVADLADPPALAELARRTRVLISTAGPYLHRGLELVRACAEAGTDYADLTGETLFVRRSIEQTHRIAVETGARIVHSCGFDSIPSDLGVGLTAEHVRRDGAGTLEQTTLHVVSMSGGLSGGTIDSLRQQVLEVGHDVEARRLIADPSVLTVETPGSPVSSSEGSRPHRRRRPVRRDNRTGEWQAPFMMGGYNRQIVLRTDALSHAVSDGGYGPGFRYREVIDTGSGPLGALAAAGVLGLTTALMGGMSVAPTRRLLDLVLPDPGEGPSERTRRNGRFLVDVVARSSAGPHYRTRIGAWHDPGYDGTAVMLAESARSLVVDDLPQRHGVITPMIAMGDQLADRLRSRGFLVRTERID